METLFISNSIPSTYKTQSSSLPCKTTASISQSHSTFFTRSYPKSHSLLFVKPQSRKNRLSVRRLGITCGVTEIREFQFSETVLKSDLPVLVEFVANWCGPCRLMAPAIDWAAQEYKDKLTVVKIDHDANPRLIEEYKVYGLPTLILFKNGQEIVESRREGAIIKAKLKDYIDTMLASISVK